MNGAWRRILVIYQKELVDLLRDHRTLAAMIIVPIVMYPLLMVGSIQAVTSQRDKLEEEHIVVGGLDDEEQRDMLRAVQMFSERMREIRKAEEKASEAGSGAAETARTPPPIGVVVGDGKDESAGVKEADRSGTGRGAIPPAPGPGEDAEPKARGADEYLFNWLSFRDEEAVKKAVQDRLIHIGIIFQGAMVDRPDRQISAKIYYDKENARSQIHAMRVNDMIADAAELWMRERVKRLGLPPTFLEPFKVEMGDLSSPGSILGQIVPLILVLMTVTGAIYPAIDVTAGERERGTLETLMACPVPIVHLIIGKFLVVTTIAILGATLNLASISATVFFGGFNEIISAPGAGLPYAELGLILLCLIPFAVLMSSIMLAVCSFARTFKEAQNYVTPVIIAVLVPGGLAAMPTTELTGAMAVMPVGNMVLLARELLSGAPIGWGAFLLILGSNVLYAAAAVALATRIFGQESVVFSDSVSLAGALNRRRIRPSLRPSPTLALITAALLFPLWFHLQNALQRMMGGGGGSMADTIRRTNAAMPVLFVIVPLALAWYWKIDWRKGLLLRAPRPIALLAALFFGASTWLLAREVGALQQALIPPPSFLVEMDNALRGAFGAFSLPEVLLLFALIPALSEECLFRGFLLQGLRGGHRESHHENRRGGAAAILFSALLFAAFHFLFYRFPITFLLGLVLGALALRSGSLWPGVLVHFMHNGLATLGALPTMQPYFERLAGPEKSLFAASPLVLGAAALLFAAGLILMVWMRPAGEKLRGFPRAASTTSAVGRAERGDV